MVFSSSLDFALPVSLRRLGGSRDMTFTIRPLAKPPAPAPVKPLVPVAGAK